MSLPFCAPPQPVVPALKACGGVDSSNAARLCTAVTTILEKASCEELASQEYLVHLIEKVGLSGDLRKERLYGQSLKYMRRIGSHSGLWQDPQQIAGALLNLGLHARRAPPPTPFSYVEVGVFTAWSCCIISAYLRRTGGGAPFSGLAVDVKAANIAASTMEMLTRLNVTFMGRSTFDRKMRAGERLLTGGAGTLPGSAGSSSKRPQFDLCFIDGDHSYYAVRSDYGQLAPHCASAMFHDIQDVSTTLTANYSGGVPLFWAHARSRVQRTRVVELTRQYAQYWPVFGIGIIWAGPVGTAEPDDGSQVREWPAVRGMGAVSLWHTLCDGTQAPGGERLPASYVQRALFCTLANEANVETVISATKRNVPRPTLEYTMALPWNSTREQLERAP